MKTVITSALLIFSLSAGLAQVETTLTHPGLWDDRFGASVSLSVRSNTILVIGSPGRDEGFWQMEPDYGAAFIYKLDYFSGEWQQVYYLSGNMSMSKCGFSVSAADDYAIAGMPGQWVFSPDQGAIKVANGFPNWINPPTTFLTPEGWDNYHFGISVDISYGLLNTSYSAVGACYSNMLGNYSTGAAYILSHDYPYVEVIDKKTNGNTSESDGFGMAVAISPSYSGEYVPAFAIVGAPLDDDNGSNSGAVHLFSITTPANFVKITADDGASNDLFGSSVDLTDSIAVVGAPLDDDNGTNSGSVYVYEENNGVWNFDQKLLPLDGVAGDLFGCSVSANYSQHGNCILVGALGVNDSTGAVYVYKLEAGTWTQIGKLTPSDGQPGDQFGYSVSQADMFTVVGSPYAYVPTNGRSGKVYVYTGAVSGLLTFIPSAIDFGNVALGSDEVIHLTLNNPGLQTLVIDSVALVGSNPQYFNVNTGHFSIAVGGSHVLDITFSPTVYGDFYATLYLLTSVGPRNISITGTGSNALTVIPGELDFGEIRIGYPETEILAVKNAGDIILTVDSVTVTGDFLNFQFIIPPCPFTLSAGELEYIHVDFSPPVPGAYSAEVTVHSLSGLAIVPVSGTGIQAGQISIAADTVDFGTTSPTLEAYDTVFVGNIGSYSIVINDVYYSGPDPDNFGVMTGMLPITLTPGSYFPFPAHFVPDDTTHFYANCHFVSNGGTDQVVLTGNGSSAGLLQVAPAAIDFGEVVNGHTVTQEVVIGNFGLTDLNVGPITITGNNAENFSIDTNSFTLEPTYIERFDVNFTPNAATSFSALLTIQSDGGTESIDLTGIGFSVLPSGETKVVSNADVFMGHVSVSQGHGVASFAQFYRADANSWIEKADFTDPAFMGTGSDVATDGLYAFVGAPYDTVENSFEAGTVLAYHQSGSSWSLMDKIQAFDFSYTDHFGHSLDFDGNHIIVGSTNDDDHGIDMGSVYIMPFHSWGASRGFKIYPADQQVHPLFGLYVAISGDYAIVGRPLDATNGFASGAVYVFEKSGPGWYQYQKLFASDAGTMKSFGEAVAMDDEYMIIGSPGSGTSGTGGAAYIFHLSAGTWQEEAILTAEHISEYFGYAVSISGEYALIGTPYADFTSYENCAGAAWLFKRNGTNWEEQRMIRPSDAHQEHHFGHAVDIDDDFLSMMIATREGELYFYGDSAFLGIDVATSKFEFALHQNKPNPFTKGTSIQFELPQAEYVTLDIYDLFGEQIGIIADMKLTAGKYDYTFDATNLPAGIYFCRLKAGEFIATKKMVLIK